MTATRQKDVRSRAWPRCASALRVIISYPGEHLMKPVRAFCLLAALPLLLAASPAPVKTTKSTSVSSKTIASPSAKTATAKRAPAKAAAKTESTSDFSETKNYQQTVTFPDNVSMTEVTYSILQGFRPLTLDLYQPQGKSDPRPVLVFIHGGNWVGGDSLHDSPFGDFPGLLASIAARGYVVASVNYRLAGEAHFPAAVLDVKTAIRFLRAHASDYNLDGTRFAAWGVSAGGHLASMVAVSCGVSALEPPSAGDDKPPSDCVQAAIDWCGLIDLETIYTDFDKPVPDTSVEGAFLGCEPALCPTEVAHNASPLTYVSAMSPPFLIQHGDADTTVSVKQSQELYDALKAQSVPAELVIYPGAAHMLAKPGQTGSLAFDPVTDLQAIAKLENFLDTTFPKNAALSTGKPAPN
jgi:acetyl esterase/lipase